jgi:hypothetical protein
MKGEYMDENFDWEKVWEGDIIPRVLQGSESRLQFIHSLFKSTTLRFGIGQHGHSGLQVETYGF